MNALASFTLDRDFFDDYYRDWLRHVQPWKALLLPAAIVLLIAGVSVLLLAPSLRITGFVILAIGLFETIAGLTKKRRWLRRVQEIPGYGSGASIEFTDEVVRIKTAHSETRLDWSVFRSWSESPTGLFLRPQSGFAIYVPDQALIPSTAKASIVQRLKNTEAAAPNGGSAAPLGKLEVAEGPPSVR